MSRIPAHRCPADQMVCEERVCIDKGCSRLRVQEHLQKVVELESSDEVAARMIRVDASLAKQLQDSMERNTRMVTRLKKFMSQRGRAFVELEAIVNDQEPAWPAE